MQVWRTEWMNTQGSEWRSENSKHFGGRHWISSFANFVFLAEGLSVSILPRTMGASSCPTGLFVRVQSKQTEPPSVSAHGSCSINSLPCILEALTGAQKFSPFWKHLGAQTWSSHILGFSGILTRHTGKPNTQGKRSQKARLGSWLEPVSPSSTPVLWGSLKAMHPCWLRGHSKCIVIVRGHSKRNCYCYLCMFYGHFLFSFFLFFLSKWLYYYYFYFPNTFYYFFLLYSMVTFFLTLSCFVISD